MKQKKKSLANTLALACVIMSAVAAIVIGVVGIWYLRSSTEITYSDYENAMLDGYKVEIKSEVQTVITVLQAEYDKAQSGVITEEEAKEEAKEIVRAMRYRDDASGYFWIDNTEYTLVMHPILSEQEGNNRYELEDKEGVMIIQEIMKVCQSSEKSGYNEFYFTKADGVTVAPKVAYSAFFEPWGWAISTGNYVDDMELQMVDEKDKIASQFQSMCMTMIIVGVLTNHYYRFRILLPAFPREI